MGRYTLTMETYDNQLIKIKLKENGKESTKVSLKTIDELTTQTSGPQDLIKKLNIKNANTLKGITITYVMNKKTKNTYVAYDSKKDLTKITLNKDANIDSNNKVFNKTIYDFLRMLENKDFYNYAMSTDLLIGKQKEYIERRIKQGDYTNFCTDKIKIHSGTYRQFRNILFIMEMYNNRVQDKKENMIHIENKEYDPDDEELYSEDEKEAYKEYLDSLPDDVPDYINDDEDFVKKL